VLACRYAVAFAQRGQAPLSAAHMQQGERLRVRLHDGDLEATVTSTRKP
jgi:exonuclease VII large subunit